MKPLESATSPLPDGFALSPGANPGEFIGSDGKEYCLPSTLGRFDLSPEGEMIQMMETRLHVVEKSVEALATKAAEGN